MNPKQKVIDTETFHFKKHLAFRCFTIAKINSVQWLLKLHCANSNKAVIFETRNCPYAAWLSGYPHWKYLTWKMAWDFGENLEGEYGTHIRTSQWFCTDIMLLGVRGKGGTQTPQPNKNHTTKTKTPMVQLWNNSKQIQRKPTLKSIKKPWITHFLEVSMPPKSSLEKSAGPHLHNT